MAITNVKNFDYTPYHDDFDETKNYHRILFRPGFAVQARELTQLQTSLQAQIDKLGQYSFKDGDRVLNGKLSLNVDYKYIKTESTYNSVAVTDVTDFIGTTITGQTSGITAEVLHAIAESSGDPITLYVKYTNSGTSTTTSVFPAGESFTSSADVAKSATVGGAAGSSIADPTGVGSAVSITEGVYFISGNMVHVPSETLILDKYTNLPSYIIGLSVTEEIKSSADSGYTDLTDNALGTSNLSAPGANRLVVSTALIKENVDLASRSVDDYIHLMTVNTGIVFKKNENPIDTELSDRLETRTQEESGDYIISPFILDIKEHLNANNNNGYLSAGQGGNADLIAVGVEPSVAYIDGRRIEKTGTEHILLDKTRGVGDQFVIPEVIQSIGFGNYIKLSKTECEGIPDINSLVVIDLKDSGSSDIGTCRARGLEFDSAEDVFRLYIFDVTMDAGKAFGEVVKVSQSTTFEATLATNNVGMRFDTGNNNLVYKLPASAIRTLKDGANHTADINLRVRLDGQTVSGGSVTFGLPSGTTLSNDDDVIFHSGALGDNQDIFEVADSNVSGVSEANITISGLTAYNGEAAVIVCTVRKLNAQAKTKTKRTAETFTFTITAPTTIIADNGFTVGGTYNIVSTGTTDFTLIGAANSTPGTVFTATGAGTGTGTAFGGLQSVYPLGEVDILGVISIRDADNNDYADRFILDNGQRDSFYDIGNVILKGGQSLPAGNYTVTFDCYRHNTGGDYFSVDSYNFAQDYASIPSFNGINLRDAIDFRPTKARTGATLGSEFSSGDGEIATNMIAPVGTVEIKITHYMGRIDKIFLTKTGTYKVVKGTSSLYPVEPGNIENAIHLYNIKLNPYVFSVSDVKVTPIDNKRYTMRDIGALDKRIKNLEYYTSLSLLEKSAVESQIFDSNGDARFKNGFIVDGFYGHNVGDTSHPDYSVSIDKENGILRPKFDERNINIVRKTGDEPANMAAAISASKAVKSAKGGIVTMPYTQVEEINQPYSSYAEFVNPYNVIIWDGSIKLSPESDEWKDVDQRPDIIIDDNSIYEQFVNMAESEGILGTVWNEWETNWTGKELISSSTKNRKNLEADEGVRLTGVANSDGKLRAEVNTTTSAFTETGTAARSGIESFITSDQQTKVVGNVIVETNFVPFMRSRKIFFKAELMKPSTRVYPFFNGVAVSTYCKEESSFTEFSDRSEVITYEGSTTHHAGSQNLTTDASGKVTGSFVIPRNEALKFKCGTREFKLTDSSANNDEDSTTKAIENYYAQGVLETYQRTIVNTKVPRIAYREVNSSKTVTKRTVETTHELVKYYDPIAESFVVKTDGGIFTTGVDLFFNQIDLNIPVCISIREVENGYPTQRIIPGSDVVVYPTDIDSTPANFANANASAATRINWDFPVYLKEGTEYAIIAISNSDKYKVYVAETSKLDLTEPAKRITKQPFDGVFFTSANASTWTPEQNKDLKFKLIRASFSGSSATVNLVNDAVPPKKLGLNPLLFEANVTATTTRLRILHKNHGMYGADGNHSVTIAGVTGTVNNVVNTAINGNHTVNDAELDSYTITITGQATSLGIRGGGVAVSATENQMYDVLKVNAATTEFDVADIKYYHTGLTAQSADGLNDGGQTLYSYETEKEILANKNIQFDKPFMIASTRNESFKSLSAKPFQMRCVLANSGKENLSPVIDLNRTSLFTIQNRINSPEEHQANYHNYIAESSGTGSSAAAKYITKQVTLNTDANVLDIYLNANKPNNSDIEVWYKITDDSDIDFDNIPWAELTPDDVIPTNSNGVYSEIHYQKDFTTLNTPFSKFSIKIVLKSVRSTDIPTIRDFRAIATT